MVNQCGPEILLEKGKNGSTPLSFSAHQGHVACVTYLLDVNDQCHNIKDDFSNMAIHCAASCGQLDILKLLVNQCGPDILLEKGVFGSTPLHLTVERGYVECVKYLLEANDQCQNIKNETNGNAIHSAAFYGQLEILKLMVNQCGPDILLKKGRCGSTPLCVAAGAGHAECVKYLLEASHQCHTSKNNFTENPIHRATYNGRLDILKLLVNQCGPDILLEKGIDGSTPLHVAAEHGDVVCVEFLLAQKIIQENLSHIDFIYNWPKGDYQCDLLLTKARKEHAAPFIKWESFDSDDPKQKRRRIGEASEWPMLDVIPDTLSRYADRASSFICTYVAIIHRYISLAVNNNIIESLMS